jgi:hydroxyacid-oxoacid transhydrogenase
VLNDTAFQMSASNIRFGPGVTTEIGLELQDRRLSRVLLIVDPKLIDLPVGQTVTKSLRQAKVDYDLFSEIHVEPTESSFRRAAEVATAGAYDAIVAVGGGSTLDTAKAANLYSTYPREFLDYVNAPIGLGHPVPGQLKPLFAIPTTAGTGSETTGVAIFDYVEKKIKTGIAHRFLRPTLGIVDPENTRTLPTAVAASSGLDVLSHALESYTARPFQERVKPGRPIERPVYQGANPISDIWSLHALKLVSRFLLRAVRDPGDDKARSQMMLAASLAGIGFGNAGVHLPHGMSYPVAGMVRGFRAKGYDIESPLIPHGVSVILNTPAVMKITAQANPKRHLVAAEALGVDTRGVGLDHAGEVLSQRVIYFMRALGIPNGLERVGYGTDDIPALVQGTLPQHRVTKLAPVEVDRDLLAKLFKASLRLW